MTGAHPFGARALRVGVERRASRSRRRKGAADAWVARCLARRGQVDLLDSSHVVEARITGGLSLFHVKHR